MEQATCLYFGAESSYIVDATVAKYEKEFGDILRSKQI